MTKEEWKELEGKITIFNSQTLMIDGFEVFICLKGGPLKYYYFLYINGEFKGSWIGEDCEIRRRFIQKKAKKLWSAKEVKGFTDIYRSKKEKAQVVKRLKLDSTIDVYYSGWERFSSLKNHLIKNNKSIEWIKK